LRSIRLGDIGTASTAGVTTGIGEALITTAAGMIVAITALAFYRLFQGLIFNQTKIFRKAGNDLELLYRQQWSETQGRTEVGQAANVVPANDDIRDRPNLADY